MEFYRYKKIIIGCFIFLSLIELGVSYYILTVYAGTYQIYIFDLLVFIQLYYCLRIFREGNKRLPLIFGGLLVVSSLLTLLVFITLPAYTYVEGKHNVLIYADLDMPLEFIDIPWRTDTIPAINNPKQLFVSDRLYYYGITTHGTNRYFIVSPITGEVNELSEPYWQKEDY